MQQRVAVRDAVPAPPLPLRRRARRRQPPRGLRAHGHHQLQVVQLRKLLAEPLVVEGFEPVRRAPPLAARPVPRPLLVDRVPCRERGDLRRVVHRVRPLKRRPAPQPVTVHPHPAVLTVQLHVLLLRRLQPRRRCRRPRPTIGRRRTLGALAELGCGGAPAELAAVRNPLHARALGRVLLRRLLRTTISLGLWQDFNDDNSFVAEVTNLVAARTWRGESLKWVTSCIPLLSSFPASRCVGNPWPCEIRLPAGMVPLRTSGQRSATP